MAYNFQENPGKYQTVIGLPVNLFALLTGKPLGNGQFSLATLHLCQQVRT
jgi:hypothetical protein